MSAAVRVLLLALATVLLGCSASPTGEHTSGWAGPILAGADDIELTYELDNRSAGSIARYGDDLRALVLHRLAAGQISADVTQEDRWLRIVVDAALSRQVDDLVTWSGTLLIVDAAPDVVLSPPDPSSGLVPKAAPSTRERWYEGTRADVLRAIEAWAIDKDHRILAEPLVAETEPWTRWRTRVVHATPAFEIGDGALLGWGDGATLRVRGASGSPAANVLRDARARSAPLFVARGRVSLGPPSFDGDALQLGFGGGAEAYARAQRERRLLTTARLPPLRRAGSVGLPPNRALAIACLVGPVLLSVAWLAFIRRFDRAHPEPIWLVASTFLLGALSTIPAALAERLLAGLSPWLDPNLATLGGRTFALPLAFAVSTLVIGFSEEGSKRLAAELAVRRREFDEPVDGIVYGIVASLGFAAAENIHYFAMGRLGAPLVIARSFMSVPAHMFFGAIWGYALGAKLVAPKTRTWGWLALAAGCHGLFDALLATEDTALLAVVLNVGLASAFVWLVRSALRHGVVTKEMLAIDPDARVLFRVGRPARFWTSAVLLHVLAFGIFLLGAYYQLARHRPSSAFVIGSSLMVLALAVCALQVTRTLPLDVAVDAYGVTFAGAARPWRKIRGFSVHIDRVELDCEAGPILLGPAPHAVVRAIAAELTERLGGEGTPRAITLESR